MRFTATQLLRLTVACSILLCVALQPAFSQDQTQDGVQTPQSIFREAYALSAAASTVEDLDRIIAMCDQGLNDDDATDDDYGRTLASWAYNKRGELFATETGNPQAAASALADFDKAVNLSPNSWRYLHNRGVSLAGAGRFEEAIADIEQVIQLQPQFAKGYFNRGELHFAQGEMPEAITAYSRAIELGRNDAEAYANRGDAYTAQSMFREALRDYQQAISLQTNLARAYQSAAWIMATSGDANLRNPREALRMATQAAQLNPEDHQAIDILALCQAGTGGFSQAAASQQRAIELAEAAEAEATVMDEYRERLQQYESRVKAGVQANGAGR